MRGLNGESRAMNNTLETIHAAANAIASTENRISHDTVEKRRWGGCWSIYWCFGSYKQKKRIGPAIHVSEANGSGSNVPVAENPTQVPSITLPFAAPPSSPASFLPSEPPSATQSPAGLVSFTSISASMYSPGPASIFAIGPYAHETQLVSPPVFSTFTTEPSTAPFTPPPESLQLTTPSSPEVPFAQFLGPNLQYAENGQRYPISSYEFQSYQLHPGSPVGQLISPSSGISGSGTSSPFPDGEFATGLQFPEFRMGDPPKLLNLDKLSSREWGSHHGSGTLTPDAARSTSRNGFILDHHSYEIASHLDLNKEQKSSPGSFTPDATRSTPCNGFILDHHSYEIASHPDFNKEKKSSSGTLTPDASRSTPRNGFLLDNHFSEIASHPDFYKEKQSASGALTPDATRSTPCNGFLLDHPFCNIASHSNSDKEKQSDVVNRRVSFELTNEETVRCLKMETAIPAKAVSESLHNESSVKRKENDTKVHDDYESRVGETSSTDRPEKAPADTEGNSQHHKNRSITLGSSKEFNFDNVDGGDDHKPIVSSDWWANEKVTRKDDGISRNWSFFPMIQPGVS